MPLPTFSCDNIINPFGRDALNEYLQSSTADFNGNVTLVYYLPNYIQINVVNNEVDITNNGALKDMPGYYQLKAYIKCKKDFQKPTNR